MRNPVQNWNEEANEIYFEATQILNPNDRIQFLDERCRDRSALRQQVDEMLAIDSSAEQFFSAQKSAVQELSNQVCGSLAKWREGAIVDRYQLLQKIGEGGFALVFAAKQLHPVERTVALKLIKPGMDTQEVIARFAAEQQALAMMDHPNIAKVLDAGATVDGRPFFVMELVRGTPLTTFCDARNLTLHDRLELFDSVCDAIHHAHQKGVIHRDIKPSNILVTLERDHPTPKVIDFGIAKALSRKLTEKTLFTRFGQVIGTPEYMSPEQADDDAKDVDTRSDIYSLGVLLHELVTGLTPIDGQELRSAGWGEMMRLIREQHTLRPSDRLSSAGEQRFVLARQRSMECRSLCNLLRGELDWIVLKAIDRNQARRYQSASDFARDIRRYLANEPVEARRPSTLYTLNKFVKRHRATVIVVTSLAVAILGGLFASTAAWISADEAERQAIIERNRANEAADQLGHNLYASILARAGLAVEDGKLTHAQELLERSPLEHRGWEWEHLSQRSRPRHLVSAPDVPRSTYLPDGSLLVRVQNTNGLFVLDPEKGERHPTKMPVEAYDHFTVSADGRLVFYSLATGEFGVSELETGSRIWHSEEFVDGAIWHVEPSFSRNGTRVVLKSSDGIIRVFEAASGKLLLRKPKFVPNCGVTLSPDGDKVAIGYNIWDIDTEKLHASLPSPNDPSWHWIHFSDDGKLLARTTLSGSISLLNAKTGEWLFDLNGHRGAVTDCDFSPNSEWLASTGVDGTHRLWDLRSRRQIRVLGAIDGHSGWIEISPDGSQFRTQGISDRLKTWSLYAPDVLTLQGNGDMMRDVIFLPAEQPFVLTSEVRGPVRLWDSASGKLKRTFWVSAQGAGVLAAHPNGRQFAVAVGGRIEFWDWQTGNRDQLLAGHAGEITRLRIEPEGEFLVSLSANQLKIWDIASGRLVREHAYGNDVMGSLSISPDGKWAAAIKATTPSHRASGTEIDVFDLRSGRVINTLESHPSLVTALEFAEIDVGHGRRELVLAVGQKDAHITIYKPLTGDVLKTVKGHASWCSSLAFNPEGTRMWATAADGSFTVWDPSLGEELVNLKAHDQACLLSISNDGATVATNSLGGEVKLWESQPVPNELRRLRMSVARANTLVDRHQIRFECFAEALQSLRTTPVQSSELQALAEEILLARGPNVRELIDASRSITLLNDQPAENYKLALRLALAASDVLPNSPTCQTTAGLAYCRLGQYRKAIELFEAARVNHEATFKNTPSSDELPPETVDRGLRLLFSAIAYHFIDNQEFATRYLNESRKLTSLTVWPADLDIASIVLEVESLLGRHDQEIDRHDSTD